MIPLHNTTKLTPYLVAGLLLAGNACLNAQELQFAELGECSLESGEVIRDCRIGYRTVGTLNPDRSNAILFPTWYGGTSENILGLLGPDAMIDTTRDFVIVVDAFGNGVSSSASNSPNQAGAAFPRVTIRDMVRHQHRMLEQELGITSLKAVTGISMGGMQAFEWAVSYPGFARKIVPVVGSPRLAPYDIVLWEMALEIMDWFLDCRCQSPAAVQHAMWILVGGPDYHARVNPRDNLAAVRAQVANATMEEGRAYDLSTQLHAMIDHDVSLPLGGSLQAAAELMDTEMFVIVGLTDHVVTPGPALEFARLAGADTLVLPNDCGHAAPQCEAETFNTAVREFLAR